MTALAISAKKWLNFEGKDVVKLLSVLTAKKDEQNSLEMPCARAYLSWQNCVALQRSCWMGEANGVSALRQDPVWRSVHVIASLLQKTVSWVSIPQLARHPLSLRTWHGTLTALGGGEGRATISRARRAGSCCHVRSSSVAVTREEVRPGSTGFSHLWDDGEIMVFRAPHLHL